MTEAHRRRNVRGQLCAEGWGSSLCPESGSVALVVSPGLGPHVGAGSRNDTEHLLHTLMNPERSHQTSGRDLSLDTCFQGSLGLFQRVGL